MAAVTCIFIVVFGAAIASILIGFHEASIYLIKNSKRTEKTKKRLTRLCDVAYFVLSIGAVFAIANFDKLLTQTLVGNYIAVIIYTLLLGLLSANALYISPSTEVNSVFKAFRRGFTKANVNNIIPNLYIKPLSISFT